MLREAARELEKQLPQGWRTKSEEAAEDRLRSEMDRLRQGFNAPAPSVPENRAGGGDPGYNADARRGLDRLLRAAQETGDDATRQ